MFVQVDWDLDLLSETFLLSLLLRLVNPLQVSSGQGGGQLVTKLDPLFMHVEFSSFHAHFSADEALVVLGQLVRIQVQLELELKFFQRPALVLGNSLSSGSQESFGIKESSEPKTALSESRVLLQPLQLVDSLDEVCDPGGHLNSIRDLVLVPLDWRDFSEDLLSDETELVGALPGAFTHLKQEV